MRLLGLDLETTGFDTAKDRITELGVVLWDVPSKLPLITHGAFLNDPTYPKLSEEVIRVTGITDGILAEFGTSPTKNLEWLVGFSAAHGVDYIVAHNGENFDRPLLMAELTRHEIASDTFRTVPWIDTRTDIPFVSEPDSRKLKHLAGDHGFINPFSHRAVFDVLTMLKVLSHYDMQAVLDYQKIPFITVRAIVSYEDKQLAKDQRYSWEKLGERTYPKMWVKRIKADKLAQEEKNCKFQIARIE